jgi:hypothetical protein
MAVKVKKVLREIVSLRTAAPEAIKVDFKKFKADEYRVFVREGGILTMKLPKVKFYLMAKIY